MQRGQWFFRKRDCVGCHGVSSLGRYVLRRLDVLPQSFSLVINIPHDNVFPTGLLTLCLGLPIASVSSFHGKRVCRAKRQKGAFGVGGVRGMLIISSDVTAKGTVGGYHRLLGSVRRLCGVRCYIVCTIPLRSRSMSCFFRVISCPHFFR